MFARALIKSLQPCFKPSNTTRPSGDHTERASAPLSRLVAGNRTEYEEDYYASAINHGTLYPNLDTLVEKGLVEKGTKDSRTNVYSITNRGEQAIEARQEWVSQYTEVAITA